MFFLWVVVLFGLAAVMKAEAEDCTREKLQQCWNEVNPDSQLTKVFPDEEYLERNCGLLLNVAKCATEFSDRCPESDTKDVKMIKPMSAIVTTLCDENSDIRKGYVENVECYENHPSEMYTCAMGTVAVHIYVEQMKNSTDINTEDLESCLGTTIFLDCIIEEIAEECENEETKPLATILNQVSDIFAENVCPEIEMDVWKEDFLHGRRNMEA